jgi:hypothetical protein
MLVSFEKGKTIFTFISLGAKTGILPKSTLQSVDAWCLMAWYAKDYYYLTILLKLLGC